MVYQGNAVPEARRDNIKVFGGIALIITVILLFLAVWAASIFTSPYLG